MSGAIILFPLYAFMAWTRKSFNLPLHLDHESLRSYWFIGLKFHSEEVDKKWCTLRQLGKKFAAYMLACVPYRKVFHLTFCTHLLLTYSCYVSRSLEMTTVSP